MPESVEPLSDHPLFRALVLMGGGLAVGCGGIARGETPVGIDIAGSGPGSGGAPAAGTGAQSAAGGAGAEASAFYNPSCPYEQWDCGAGSINTCPFNLASKDDPLSAGCRCDTSRPTSAAACKPGENFVCRQAYPPYVEAQPKPSTWDGTLHVQCACVPAPTPSSDNCNAICEQAFSGIPDLCTLPAKSMCDESGACTATAADVLRQDGILCGCFYIGLK